MLTQWIRCLYNETGTLVDHSIDLQSETSVTSISGFAASGYIIIGQQTPFNTMYLGVTGANTTTSEMQLEYWSGSLGWQDCRDIMDETSASGKTLAKSGIVQFDCDDNYAWNITEESDESAYNPPPELFNNNIGISQLYWLKMSFSNGVSASTKLNQIGYMFCDDLLLNSIEPQLSSYLDSWKSGKTNWNQQSILGSKLLIRDLQNKGFITSAGQLYYLDDLALPAAFRTLAIIFDGLEGDRWIERKKEALAEYHKLVNGAKWTIDTNKSGQKNLQGNVKSSILER